MKITQVNCSASATEQDLARLAAAQPQLLLVFGSVAQICRPGLLQSLRQALPGAVLAGCSTAGEISNAGVGDDTLVLTGLHFDAPDVRLAVTDLRDMADSFGAGQRLAQALSAAPLHNVMLFGLGVNINGSALIDGLRSGLPAGVAIAGGLAGDGGAFSQTFTLSTHAVSSEQIVALGFGAARTVFSHGSLHGWQPFGPARQVTRSEGNVLYELDGERALEVYRRYLGDYAAGLPATGLLFPFEMQGANQQGRALIRTILGVDTEAGSLVLAGDISAGAHLRLMHASIDSLVNGAEAAAQSVCRSGPDRAGDALALMVTCVGRKLVMGARVEEEVEAVADVLGAGCHRAGFYSYGEISPGIDGSDCNLHNQTMTITHLSECV